MHVEQVVLTLKNLSLHLDKELKWGAEWWRR